MKQSFKRILSMLCALMMLLGCFSTTALAADVTVDEGIFRLKIAVGAADKTVKSLILPSL